MDARKVSGFEDSKNESNFLKFMVEDEPLPGIDNTYTLTPNHNDEPNDEPKEEEEEVVVEPKVEVEEVVVEPKGGGGGGCG